LALQDRFEGLARIGGKLPLPHHDQNASSGWGEGHGTDKPSQVAEREEECTLTTIKMAAGVSAKTSSSVSELAP
jgi:hypothetical protein